MMDAPTVLGLLTRITYKDWRIELVRDVHHLEPDTLFVRVTFDVDGQQWKGRKWYISPHMTESEVVQTALLAVLQAEEHETREAFKVDGRAIYGPHHHVDALLHVAGTLDVRQEIATRS